MCTLCCRYTTVIALVAIAVTLLSLDAAVAGLPDESTGDPDTPAALSTDDPSQTASEPVQAAADTTPPTTPVVKDSGVCAQSTTTLKASWSSTDAQSRIRQYWYAISTSPTSLSGDVIVPWTNVGTATSITRKGLRLTPGHTYYWHVAAVNAAGLESQVGVSDGIVAGTGYRLLKRDLLEGYGDFSHISYTRWWSTYPAADYDFGSNPFTLYFITSGSLTDGFNTRSELDTAANGWNRFSDTYVHPVSNIVCQIVDRPDANVSGAQSIALTKVDRPGSVVVERHLPIGSEPHMLHPGDTILYRIDKVWMQDFAGLSVTFALQLYFNNGKTVTRTMTPSTAVQTYSVPLTVVPSGATDVNVRIKLSASGSLGTQLPALLVDDAHIYVKRAGTSSYEQLVMPAPRERAMKGHIVHAEGDSYAIAGRYDDITIGAGSYSRVQEFRHMNPDARVFLYYSGAHFLQTPSGSNKDPFTALSPVGFIEAASRHPEWMYDNGIGVGGFVHDPAYPDRYYARITNTDYQNTWIERIVKRLKDSGADGVWIDDMVSHPAAYDSIGKTLVPDYEPSDVQQFLHTVVPALHAQGFKVIQNAGSHNIGSQTFGRNVSVYFDPFWKADPDPNAVYAQARGYNNNTADNTPDIWFQEYSFVRPYNGANLYTKSYWLECLESMDAVERWNTSVDPATGSPLLTEEQQKVIHICLMGVDLPSDPVQGINGWYRFGLCSFLLGRNDWTYFGSLLASNGGADTDLSITRQLGSPAEPRRADGPDCYYRIYSGGVVVVNCSPSASASYAVPFNVVDENGVSYSTGDSINLPARTGRILLAN